MREETEEQGRWVERQTEPGEGRKDKEIEETEGKRRDGGKWRVCNTNRTH